MDCSVIKRWDNAFVLLENGADLTIRNINGEDYSTYLKDRDIQLPPQIANWIESNYMF